MANALFSVGDPSTIFARRKHRSSASVVFWSLSLIVIAAAAPAGQTAERITHASGRVVDAATGAAILNARVTVSSSKDNARTMQTDQSGTFSLSDIPVGSYQVVVTADGFYPGVYGQVWPKGPGTPLRLTGNNDGNITIRLWRPGSISGTVTTAAGEPFASASVQLLSAGRTASGGASVLRSARTDKTGAYHFTDVLPGDYVVGTLQSYRSECRPPAADSARASARASCHLSALRGALPPTRARDSGRTDVYVTTFYPGTSDLTAAQTITLQAGAQTTGVDFTLEARPTVDVAGAVTMTANGPVTSPIVSLTRLGNAAPALEELRHAVTSPGTGGRFVLAGVPPGDYELRAIAYPKNGEDVGPHRVTSPWGNSVIGGYVAGTKEVSEQDPLLEARVVVSVGTTDLGDLSLVLQPGSRVRGTTAFTGSRAAPAPEALSGAAVALRPLKDTGSTFQATASLDANGAFDVPSLASGAYSIAVTGLTGWSPVSVEMNGRVAEDLIVDVTCCGTHQATITLGDSASSLVGTVAKTDRQPIEETVVFLFPMDSRSWARVPAASDGRFRMARPSADGSFTLGSLRAGDYYVVALRDAAMDTDWRHPDILSRLKGRGAKVEIKEGENATVSLRAVGLD